MGQDLDTDPVVQFAECDVAEVIRDSVAAASQASPSVPVEIHAPQTLVAIAYPEALERVLRILVETACRRTGTDATVTVKANRGEEGIAVHVIDRGSGAAADRAELDLARSLVSLHGGTLWLEPLPAGGTRSSFVIPTEPPALDSLERQAAIELLKRLAEVRAQPALVLQVEEESPVELEILDEEAAEPDPILDLTDIGEVQVPLEPAAEPEATHAAVESAEAQGVPRIEVVESAEDPSLEEGSEPMLTAAARVDEPKARPRRRRWQPWSRRKHAPSEVEGSVEPIPADMDVETPPAPAEGPPAPVVQPPPAIVDSVESVIEREPPGPPPKVEGSVPVATDPEPPEAPPTVTTEALNPPPPEPPEPEPAAEPEGPPAWARGLEEPLPFVPDPLDPATQMLRSLVLDYEQEHGG
jgi:hypothetical protein